MKQSVDKVKYWADNKANTIALIAEGRNYTWKELDTYVTVLSLDLASQGLKAADVLACVSKNCIELVILYLACIRTGVIPALISPQPSIPLEKKLKQLACGYFWLGNGAMQALDGERSAINLLANEVEVCVSDKHDELINVSVNQRAEEQNPIASLVFTSGSTGHPKAVAHSADNHLKSAEGLLRVFTYKPNDSWLLSLPLFHVSGLAILWRWLSVGAILKVGAGKSLSFDLNGVSHASLVPTQLQRLLNSEEKLSLTHVLLGGSAIPNSLAIQAKNRGIETWLGYGMTEAASTVTAKPVDENSGVGQVLPFRRLKLEGQNIVISGDTLAIGYFYQGDLHPVTDDDWFESGDLGKWIDGELHILGRADNQFISGGENIHCEEIESVLVQHADIAAVFVLAVQDVEYGARPVAVISSRAVLRPEHYECLLKSHLEKFKWPIDYISLPDELLQTGGIKVSRFSVSQWFRENQSRYTLLN